MSNMRISTWFANKHFIYTILLVCVNIHDVMNAVTYVKREAGKGKRDIFGLIPNSCSNYAAANTGRDKECKCSFDYSTFLYSNMTCVSNSDIQQKLWTGCPTRLLYFSNQNAKSPYVVVDLSKPSSKQNVHFHDVDKIKGEHCNVSQIHYIDDSNGNLITPNVGNDIFTIDKHNKSLNWKTGAPIIFNGKVFRLKTQNCTFKLGGTSVVTNPCIVFKVQGTLNFSTSTSSIIRPTGTSISSTRSVTVSISTHTSLVLPVRSPQVIPGASSSVSSLSGTPTPAYPGSSSVAYISTNTPRLTSVVLDTSIPVLSGTPSPTLVVPGISSLVPIGPSKPTDTKKHKDKQSSPTGAIVGSVMAIIAVAIFVVLLVIWRKRRQKSRQNDKVAKEPNDSKDNQMYGKAKGEVISLSKQQRQGPKSSGHEQLDSSVNEFEYDYAVVDGDPRSHGNRSSNGTATPRYQSLIKDPARDSVYSPLNREHDVPPEQQYTYNKVERPLYNPPRKGTPDPLYNVLDRPDDNGEDYIEPGVQIKKPNPKQAPQNNEPLYNVLEYPHQVGGKEAPQEDEPDYNVIEDPHQVGGKEAPQEDEPDYNVLEDPDGDYDNAPVETDMRHPSSHDNVGYASTIDIKSKQKPGTQRDPVYSVLEGPEGSLSEGTYQPLQIKAPDESMYQPLDRTSQIINDQPLYQVLEDKASMSNA